MKYIFTKKSILVASLIITATMFIRCAKEKESTSLNQVTSSALSDAQVEAKIKAFNEKMKDQFKSNEFITNSEAVWNIEAALNYNWCQAYLSHTSDYMDSLFVSMPLTQGQITISNATSTYNEALAKLQTLLNSSNHAVLIDLKPLNIENFLINT